MLQIIITISFFINFSAYWVYAQEPLDSLTRPQTPCITPEFSKQTKEETRRNILQLIEKGVIPESVGKKKKMDSLVTMADSHPLFEWPLKADDSYPGFDVWGISAFVDHDKLPGQLLDHKCGQRTYDLTNYNHSGTDIYIYPFSWNMMDDEYVDVIAAAPGIIVNKYDGNYDRNCGMGSAQWNAVYIRHDDGSIAWYGHMKKGSLTGLDIGARVETGDYLGKVGSSGSSTGPHLHFEIYDANNKLIDPFQGKCNSLNSDTWWKKQIYTSPAVNRMLITTNIQSLPCPQPSVYKEMDTLNYNETVNFTFMGRDLLETSEMYLRLISPDGKIFRSYNFVSGGKYYSAYYFYKTLTITNVFQAGKWSWETGFDGSETKYTKNFWILNPNNMESILAKNQLNAFFQNDHLIIDSGQNIGQFKYKLIDSYGKEIIIQKSNLKQTIIPVHNIANGIYHLIIELNQNSNENIPINMCRKSLVKH